MPAAVTSSARLAVVCPRTSEKSGVCWWPLLPASGSGFTGDTRAGNFKKFTTSPKCFIPYTLTPSTTAASWTLSRGTMTLGIPEARAQMAMESAPRTGLTEPSSESSPTNR